jgi:radical SAM-linked protein
LVLIRKHDIATLNEITLLVIKFRLRGTLRYLSHAEMLRVFQRACVRAGINIQYSRGFNPRPKMSLPLPRPVGVESDDELLCLRILDRTKDVYDLCSSIKDKLSAQLPEGCEVLSVNIAQTNKSFQPSTTTYLFTVKSECLNEGLKTRIEHLLASKRLEIQRQIDQKSSKVKNVDVRDFLESIKSDGRSIIVKCNIRPTGSIRIEEILRLLELDEDKLELPIKRTNVKWQIDGS